MSADDNAHERIREQLPAYVLGSLDREQEAEACAQHIEGCAGCRTDLSRLTDAVDRIPLDPPQVRPPAELRRRILDEVSADPRAVGPDSTSSQGRSSLRDRLRGLGLRPPAIVAAALLVCIAAAGYAIVDWGSSAESAATTYAKGEAPGVSATVVQEGDAATLTLTNVDQLDDRRVLQAWVQRDGRVEPVPTPFAPDPAGRAETTIGDMGGVTAVMVTTEPAGGSEVPTGKPFVTVEIG